MTELGLRSAAKGALILGMLLDLAVATAGKTAASANPKLQLIRAIPHSGYSEGLDYHDGFLWNALPKSILKIDPKDGNVVARYTPGSDYSESLCWWKGFLWNVSFSDNGLYKGAFKGQVLQFNRLASVPEDHAWGITHDDKNLILTGNWSNQLYFVNPDNGKVARSIKVEITNLEDLAWDGHGIWASSFTQHRGHIFRIQPETGAVSALFALPDPESCPIVDGIAFDGKALWITGKECPSIYQVGKPREEDLATPPALASLPGDKR